VEDKEGTRRSVDKSGFLTGKRDRGGGGGGGEGGKTGRISPLQPQRGKSSTGRRANYSQVGYVRLRKLVNDVVSELARARARALTFALR